MKLHHEQSSQCLRSDLDLCSRSPTHIAVDGSPWVEHRPLSTIASSYPIEFILSGSDENYMDLNNTLLEVKACIKQRTTLQWMLPISWRLQQYITQPFQSNDVSLNNVNVSPATSTYPYRSYIETHLNYGTDAKKSRIQAAMCFIDDNMRGSNPIPDSSSERNMGPNRRHVICTVKPAFDMIGPLHVDVFNQSKWMLNGVMMKVRLTHRKYAFVLMAKSDVIETFKVDI